MASNRDDPAPDVLFLPLRSSAVPLPAPGRAAFLRARVSPSLEAMRALAPVCEQGFKPSADALERAGFAVVPTIAGSRHPLVLLLAPRQRDESRALLARALDLRDEGGIVIACAGNDSGARSLQDDLARLAGPVQHLSKQHCRVCWTAPDARVDAVLHAQWRGLDAPRPVADGRFLSRPGLFAWDRIDPASALLADCLPPDLAGVGADLGAGFGYLAAEVLRRCAAVTGLDLYEAEARALALAERNLGGARVPVRFHWHDVAAGLPAPCDFAVSNPPFHAGDRADRPELGRAFIAAAARALRPGGRLLLVANRHLPYEATLADGFADVRLLRDTAGFKIYDARKAAR